MSTPLGDGKRENYQDYARQHDVKAAEDKKHAALESALVSVSTRDVQITTVNPTTIKATITNAVGNTQKVVIRKPVDVDFRKTALMTGVKIASFFTKMWEHFKTFLHGISESVSNFSQGNFTASASFKHIFKYDTIDIGGYPYYKIDMERAALRDEIALTLLPLRNDESNPLANLKQTISTQLAFEELQEQKIISDELTLYDVIREDTPYKKEHAALISKLIKEYNQVEVNSPIYQKIVRRISDDDLDPLLESSKKHPAAVAGRVEDIVKDEIDSLSSFFKKLYVKRKEEQAQNTIFKQEMKKGLSKAIAKLNEEIDEYIRIHKVKYRGVGENPDISKIKADQGKFNQDISVYESWWRQTEERYQRLHNLASENIDFPPLEYSKNQIKLEFEISRDEYLEADAVFRVVPKSPPLISETSVPTKRIHKRSLRNIGHEVSSRKKRHTYRDITTTSEYQREMKFKSRAATSGDKESARIVSNDQMDMKHSRAELRQPHSLHPHTKAALRLADRVTHKLTTTAEAPTTSDGRFQKSLSDFHGELLTRSDVDVSASEVWEQRSKLEKIDPKDIGKDPKSTTAWIETVGKLIHELEIYNGNEAFPELTQSLPKLKRLQTYFASTFAQTSTAAAADQSERKQTVAISEADRKEAPKLTRAETEQRTQLTFGFNLGAGFVRGIRADKQLSELKDKEKRGKLSPEEKDQLNWLRAAQTLALNLQGDAEKRLIPVKKVLTQQATEIKTSVLLFLFEASYFETVSQKFNSIKKSVDANEVTFSENDKKSLKEAKTAALAFYKEINSKIVSGLENDEEDLKSLKELRNRIANDLHQIEDLIEITKEYSNAKGNPSKIHFVKEPGGLNLLNVGKKADLDSIKDQAFNAFMAKQYLTSDDKMVWLNRIRPIPVEKDAKEIASEADAKVKAFEQAPALLENEVDDIRNLLDKFTMCLNFVEHRLQHPRKGEDKEKLLQHQSEIKKTIKFLADVIHRREEALKSEGSIQYEQQKVDVSEIAKTFSNARKAINEDNKKFELQLQECMLLQESGKLNIDLLKEMASRYSNEPNYPKTPVRVENPYSSHKPKTDEAPTPEQIEFIFRKIWEKYEGLFKEQFETVKVGKKQAIVSLARNNLISSSQILLEDIDSQIKIVEKESEKFKNTPVAGWVNDGVKQLGYLRTKIEGQFQDFFGFPPNTKKQREAAIASKTATGVPSASDSESSKKSSAAEQDIKLDSSQDSESPING